MNPYQSDDRRDPAQRPEVTIVMPAYRTAKYIAETLDAVFAQTFSNFELIIVNDGSPDTAELEVAIAPWRHRMLYVSLAKNGGASVARNVAIRHARGEYLALLDGDDIWLPTFLERCLAALRANPALDVFWTDMTLFGPPALTGKRIMALHPPRRPVEFRDILECKFQPLTSAVLVRKSAVEEIGGFDEESIRAEDFDLYVRLAWAGKNMDFLDEPLVRRRLHATANSASYTMCQDYVVRVFRKLRALPGMDTAAVDAQIAKHRAYRDLYEGQNRILAGEGREAVEPLKAANRYLRSPKLGLLTLALQIASPLAMPLAQQWAQRERPTS